jgi:hypothetical protein
VAGRVALVALGVETACAFLPWVRTGNRDRTSFEVIGAARELDVLRSPVERILAAAWYGMPLLAALAVLAAALGARRVMAVFAIGAGALGVAVGLGVATAPFAHYAPLTVSLVASAVAIIAGIGVFASTSHSTDR